MGRTPQVNGSQRPAACLCYKARVINPFKTRGQIPIRRPQGNKYGKFTGTILKFLKNTKFGLLSEKVHILLSNFINKRGN
jgi:hypothetical protein